MEAYFDTKATRVVCYLCLVAAQTSFGYNFMDTIHPQGILRLIQYTQQDVSCTTAGAVRCYSSKRICKWILWYF